MSSPIVPPPRSASALAEAMVQTTSQASVLRRWGIVHAINANATLNVDIAGVVIPNLKRVASYEPTVGERVLIDAVGTDLTVIGATAPSPRAYVRPTGDIEATIRKTPKPDTLFLQGQTISRTEYARLFAWVQEQGLLTTPQSPNNLFGSGNGSTTFTLPDWRGRVLSGASTTRALGTLFGVGSFLMDIEQMPDHKHAVTVANHADHYHLTSVGTHSHHHNGTGSVGHHDHAIANAGSHSHIMSNPRYINVNAHAHINRPNTAAEGPYPDSGVAANIWTAGAGDHNHAMNWNGGHAHSISTDSHSHVVNVGNTSLSAHSITEQFVGGNQQIDLHQPSVAINYLIWV